MQPSGHFFAHMPHLKQPAEQSLRICGLLSLLFAQTATEPFVFASKRVKSFLGQVFTHFAQPVHLLLSTTGSPSFPMLRAPNWQASTQSPSPMQPKAQSFVPFAVSWAAAQVFTPL